MGHGVKGHCGFWTEGMGGMRSDTSEELVWLWLNDRWRSWGLIGGVTAVRIAETIWKLLLMLLLLLLVVVVVLVLLLLLVLVLLLHGGREGHCTSAK
jgi:hypothetical protein